MPAHQWLIAALCDEKTNINEIELTLRDDITRIMNEYATLEDKPFPYTIDLVFEWIPISEIEPGINSGFDEFFELSIASHIIKRIGNLTLRALAMLLDRNLLKENNLEHLFTRIVKHRFFNPTRQPTHFMCCFGDTPSNDMRYREPSPSVCHTYGWCAKCSDNTLVNCRHTCYWHLLGLMLGAYPVPRPNQNPSKTIVDILPSKFVY
ncbi:MAG: hypothetical protein FWE27_04150 [Defluviitaleaceae bacterium]|nr:hypothetical protein [Defluviitaleaceae bacterium]